MKKIKGVNKVHVDESRLDIKEVKGLSCQITLLTTAKSIESHAYNQFDHDSY